MATIFVGFMILSTELKGDSLKAARRLAAQPGGLMLGFAPHLVICIFRCILLYTCVYFRVYSPRACVC